MEWTRLLDSSLPALFTFLAGLVGVRLGLRQVRLQMLYDFIEKQLNCLYSPLLGLHHDIKSKSGLRAQLHNAATEAWADIAKRRKNVPGWNSDKEYEPFARMIDYDNRELISELLPQYREMLRVLKDNLWLAEPATRRWYAVLSSFVDVWDRSQEKSLPARS